MRCKWLVFSMLLGILLAGGCGKQGPLAPEDKNLGNKNSPAVSRIQQMRPTNIVYEGIFGGYPNYKPWNWFDADDNPAFNATIRTNSNGQSANITRVNGGTWGKVYTQAITCTNDFNKIRIFVASHSASMTWKLGIQEEGGAWRFWVIQDSTGQTGYLDYDFSSILQQVNSGGGKFTINLIVEGAVGEYLEVSELYVFQQVDPANSTINVWWEQTFPVGALQTLVHTPGWFDQTTNVGFNAYIQNLGGGNGRIVVFGQSNTDYGKVLSPVIHCNTQIFKKMRICFSQAEASMCSFQVGIQEQGGAYRHWWVQETPYDTYDHPVAELTWDISQLPLTSDVPFSVEIILNMDRVENTPFILGITDIGIYKQ